MSMLVDQRCCNASNLGTYEIEDYLECTFDCGSSTECQCPNHHLVHVLYHASVEVSKGLAQIQPQRNYEQKGMHLAGPGTWKLNISILFFGVVSAKAST